MLLCMQTQVPFTGGSGRLLDQAFDLASVCKEQLYITNVVHCHPPDNRPSRPEEIENCSEYLCRELEIVRPKLVIGLGKDAREWLLRLGWHSAYCLVPNPFVRKFSSTCAFSRFTSFLLAPAACTRAG